MRALWVQSGQYLHGWEWVVTWGHSHANCLDSSIENIFKDSMADHRGELSHVKIKEHEEMDIHLLWFQCLQLLIVPTSHQILFLYENLKSNNQW